MNLESELREIVHRFNEAKIEYALCGGMAVAIHGYPRFTKDIDFLIPNRFLEQAKKLAAAVGFLDESARVQFPDADLHRLVKTSGTDYRVLDILVPKDLNTIAWKTRVWFDWNGLEICVVSAEGLVEMKRDTGRDQDKLDIRKLGFETDE
ncbi:MAG: nucleotidyl transferase AbiEii/AbiGii toxin family protein [Planctomycetales bacterium]|nr:nucleotidyl transferase AbiEii/AbiGii toxin family protein [Planctomycetales bacterium]